jgi:hypothetical protein
MLNVAVMNKVVIQGGLAASRAMLNEMLRRQIFNIEQGIARFTRRLWQFKIGGSAFGRWRRDKLINGRWRWGR